MKYMKLLRNNRGDTIVEVLIVVAVLGFILAGAFVVSNRSSQATRQAQERSESYKITETQMELLKTYLGRNASPDALPASGTKFCMKADATPTEAITGNVDDFATFNNANLASCKNGELYNSYIQRNGNTFTAYTKWFKVTGNGIDQSSMVHRIYPDVASTDTGSAGSNLCPANQGLSPATGTCVPCSNGFASPGGSVLLSACQPLAPEVIVNVRRISPDPGNNTPSCGKAATENRAGILTYLSRTGFSAGPQPTNGASDATFSGLSQNTTYSASATAPAGHELCGANPVTTGGLGPAPGVPDRKRVDLKVRPVCYQTYYSTWSYDPVPGTYYSDVVGYAHTGWIKGTRAGHAGYPNELTDGWRSYLPPNWGNSHISGQYPSGNWYWLEPDGRTNRAGQYWYNLWVAHPTYTPIYGAPYHHAYQWNETRNYYNACP